MQQSMKVGPSCSVAFVTCLYMGKFGRYKRCIKLTMENREPVWPSGKALGW